ncbi:hypothetical protein Emag_002532 [Eimeria magna]
MQSGEPSWLVVSSLRDVHREMVYDRAMLEIFPRRGLRRFVTWIWNIRKYSYAVAPYRVESDAQVDEDYARRWHAFGVGELDYPSLRAVENFPALTSSVEREEGERESDENDQGPPAQNPSPASAPSTSVGGTPPVAASPRGSLFCAGAA